MADNEVAARSVRRTVALATVASLVIGFVCVFVRSPLPWGWEGIDRYHERALSLATGHGFPTMDVPIGYALFLAGWYRIFGDHPVVPIVAQVLLNALMPLLVYRLVRTVIADIRIAALAALLVGL